MVASRLVVASLVFLVTASCSDDSSSPTGPSPTVVQQNGVPSMASAARPVSTTAVAGPPSQMTSTRSTRSLTQVYGETSDQAPGSVQSLRQLPGPGVALSWDRPAVNEWTSRYPVILYQVERDGTLVGGVLAQRDCNETEGCIYWDPNLRTGSYTFRVWAENPDPGPASSIIAVVDDSVPDDDGEPSDPAPGPVQNLRQLPGSGIGLSWDRPAINEWTSQYPVIRYQVERDGIHVGGALAERDCTATEGCIYWNPDLGPGSYTFTVWAENPDRGPVSNIIAVVEAAVPTEVRDLAGEQVPDDNAVRLTWQAPLTASGGPDDSILEYQVRADGSPYSTVTASECSGEGHAVSCTAVKGRLSLPDTHSFTVAAVNSAGTGPKSYVDVHVADWESPPLPFTAHFANAPSSHNGSRPLLGRSELLGELPCRLAEDPERGLGCRGREHRPRAAQGKGPQP